MIKKYEKIIITVLFSISLIFTSLIFGCKSLKLFEVKGQPQSCNDMYTQMDWNLKNGIKTTTLITLWRTQCQADRDKIVAVIDADKRQGDCQRQYYGKDVVNPKKYDIYIAYLKCIK